MRVLAVPLNSSANNHRIYLIPGVDGTLGRLRPFAEALSPGVQVHGLTLSAPPEPGTTVEAIAARYAEYLGDRGRGETSFVAGFSFGTFIATEVCRTLAAAGTPPRGLIVIDTLPSPGLRMSGSVVETQWYLARDHGLRTGQAEFEAMTPQARLDAACADWRDGSGTRDVRSLVSAVFLTIERNFEAVAGHEVTPYRGPVGVVAATESEFTRPNPALWRPAYPDGVAFATVGGDHAALLRPASAAGLAAAVRVLVDELDGAVMARG